MEQLKQASKKHTCHEISTGMHLHLVKTTLFLPLSASYKPTHQDCHDVLHKVSESSTKNLLALHLFSFLPKSYSYGGKNCSLLMDWGMSSYRNWPQNLLLGASTYTHSLPQV